jgi:hypothetical protein
VAESVGHLVNRRIQIPPGGNAVLSYLDIVAPDDTSSRKIATAIVDASDLLSNRSLPLEVQSADVSFEFNAGFPFAGAWRRELLMLMRAALATRTPEGFDPDEFDPDEPF